MKKETLKVLLLLALVMFLISWLFNSVVLKTARQNQYMKWAERTAGSFMQRSPDYRITYKKDRNEHKWHYEQGLMMNALYGMWQKTDDQKYFDFIQKNIDQYLLEDGSVYTYDSDKFKLDDIGPGRTLLRLYDVTGDEKYKAVADMLRKHIENQPRTESGGFWHKKIYKWQMWLDGLYMAAPFYADYEKRYAADQNYDDILHQFELIYRKTYDSKTGLLYHGWDEKKQQIWADPETGRSPHFWGRGIGWYLMALVDVLEILPENVDGRDILLKQLNDLSDAMLQVRDENAKVWYQIVNLPNRDGNYKEASVTAMVIYAWAKGVNCGYLPTDYNEWAKESFTGFIKEFTEMTDDGLVNIFHTCSGAGLGGKTNRDGSFEYYMSEPQRTNDCKAIGPFIMAALELSKATK
jgi:unsaturated rhamnogalacturonyl hydrolase